MTISVASSDDSTSRVKELNSSNLESINAAGRVAPNLKYSVQAYLDLIPQDALPTHEDMYHESDWDFINNPRSIAFRLYEEAVYYYYIKQLLLKPMFQDLLDQVNAILAFAEQELE